MIGLLRKTGDGSLFGIVSNSGLEPEFIDVKEQSEKVDDCRAAARAAIRRCRETRKAHARHLREVREARKALRKTTRAYWCLHGRYLKRCLESAAPSSKGGRSFQLFNIKISWGIR